MLNLIKILKAVYIPIYVDYFQNLMDLTCLKSVKNLGILFGLQWTFIFLHGLCVKLDAVCVRHINVEFQYLKF
jgi:hypothetical protein